MRNVTRFLDSLAEEGVLLEELAAKAPEEKAAKSFSRRFRRWRRSVLEVFSYIKLSDYSSEAISFCGINSAGRTYEIASVTGLIESARDLIKNGLVGNIKFILHAEMFGTMVEQARALLATGHIIPAAVLGRIVIEDWLRDSAEREGLQVNERASAASVNEALKQASIFSVPRWRQVQTYLDVGNAAAHGKTSEFTPEDVSKLLDFIEANCI